MSGEEGPRSRAEAASSDSAVIFVLDAAILMIMVGLLQSIVGLVGISVGVILHLRDRERVMIMPAGDATSVGVMAVAPF